MDRTRLACLALLASAFVLAALLIVRLPNLTGSAYAGLLDDNGQGRFTVFTASTRTGGTESLFVLDQVNEKLLIYDVNPARGANGQLDLNQVVDLPTKVFTGSGTGPGAKPPRPHP